MRQAVSGAFRQKDHTQFKALMDDFLATARGEDYCRALCLQADWLLYTDLRHAVQGFLLVDEALEHAKNPATKQGILTTGLGLCCVLNDLKRAERYEEEACRLLFEHATDPEVRANRHRLQLNLGQVAYLRGDDATAYWHLAQAAESLNDPAVPEAERKGFASPIQFNIATACLRVRRYYEAQEALDLALQTAINDAQRLRAKVWYAELLRQLGRIEEVQHALKSMENDVATCSNPDVRSRYNLCAALTAQDLGDLPRFHELFAKARDEASEHQLDFLLCEIQRIQRSPI
ncbi:MAG TPA: hypothetical protein VNT26_05370 [Candidatus Sulfotelmatobacter sp.]|nr:hypothetical protein [Candidatus Sulfotelmatobacter sp.]